MKLKLLILFLFTLCAQNAAATDKRRNNGRIKKIVGVLLLNHLALNAWFTQTNALCPATLPPYATDMMQYIYCADKEQTVDSFDKYLENPEVEYCSPFKLKLQKLYEKVKKLGKCAKEKYTDIVHGAKQRIVGKTTDRNTEVEMFQEYVLNLEGVDNAEELSKSFEGMINSGVYKPDFFEFKSVLDLHSRMVPKMGKSEYFESVELSMHMLMNTLLKGMNYEQVHRLMPFFKNMDALDQYKMATGRTWPFLAGVHPKYQDYDLDRSEKVLEALKEFFPDDPDNETNALEPWIQQKDLSSEKIDEIYKKCKSIKNQRQCWNVKTMAFKKSDL